MTAQQPDTPNTLEQAAQDLQQEQQRLDALCRKSDQSRLEAENLARQAQDLRKKLVKDARKQDAELKEIAQQEKEAKELPAFVQAKESFDRARKDSGLEKLAADKKERRKQIDDDIDSDPELQELRWMAEVRATQAEEAETELQQPEQRVTQESYRLITRVEQMQLTLF